MIDAAFLLERGRRPKSTEGRAVLTGKKVRNHEVTGLEVVDRLESLEAWR